MLLFALIYFAFLDVFCFVVCLGVLCGVFCGLGCLGVGLVVSVDLVGVGGVWGWKVGDVGGMEGGGGGGGEGCGCWLVVTGW